MEGQMLKEPMSIKDLLKGGKKFEIRSDFTDVDILEDYNCDSDEEDNNPIDANDLNSPWLKSFEELKVEMPKLHHYMHKTVVVKGDNNGYPKNRSQVFIDYNAYFEGEITPFDSTYLRGTQLAFIVGQSDVLTGIQEAVLTMAAGEKSQFLISYQMLFGELGCLPRIKPKADALFVIKLSKFTEVCDDATLEELSEEHRNKYPVVLLRVKEMHLKGLNEFKRAHFNNAAKLFYRSAAALSNCRLASAEEENEQKIFLGKLYTNLAVCYNKLVLPRKTCQMCNELRRMNQMKDNAKALYNEGHAYVLLCDYQMAQKSLLAAQKLEPANAEINKELKTLFIKKQKSKENEKEIWQKAIGVINTSKSEEDGLNTEFRINMKKMMEKFKSTGLNSITLHDSFQPEDVEPVSKLADEIGLKLTVSPQDEKTYILQKKY